MAIAYAGQSDTLESLRCSIKLLTLPLRLSFSSIEPAMTLLSKLLLATCALLFPAFASAADTTAKPIVVTVESTLTTGSDHIRQFAFDGDKDSYFASEKNPTEKDSFTMRFDKPVAIKSLSVFTGRSKDKDELEAGVIEISADGKEFKELAKFEKGSASVKSEDKKVMAIRIRPTEELKHPLVIREIILDSSPAVRVFKYPVEIALDVTEVPEMKEWGEKVIKICERNYAMINEELPSEGFKPPHLIHMRMTNSYRGVAATSSKEIMGAPKYFKSHPDDVGAMVHETVHVVQSYRGRNRTNPNPGWLVEGIADYVRFFKFEPGNLGRIDPKSHYDGAYRITASFLNFLTEKYDKEIVRKLNAAMRAGEYKDDLFKEYTKKELKTLDDEWRATLKK